MTALSLRNVLAAVALAAGLAAITALYLSHFLGHDQSWCLYAAERMLDGAQIYGSRLVETNPPLVLWFSLVPALFSRFTHLNEAMSFHLLVLLLASGSTLLCYRLLARIADVERLLLTAAVFFTETTSFVEDLGQREQLLVLLVLPYLLAFATGAASSLRTWQLLGLGFLAGVGVCFKPQQITILLALQVGVLIAHGPRAFVRRREWLAVLGAFSASLAYVAAVRFVTPLYLLTLVPILADTYWALGRYTFWQLMRTQHHFPQILLFATIIFWWGRRRKLLSAAPGFLLVAAVGACVGYGTQHAGFSYHRVPQNGFVELAIFGILIELAAHWLPALFASSPITRPQVALFALALGIFYVPLSCARAAESDTAPPEATMQGFLRTLAPGTPVWVVSVDLSAYFPEVLTSHLVWGSRFNHLWMMPAIQQNEAIHMGGPLPAKVLPPERLRLLEESERQAAVEDLDRWHPRFVLVSRCETDLNGCLGYSAPFDTLAWFKRDPVFAAAWAHYRMRQTIPNNHNGALFEVYERQE